MNNRESIKILRDKLASSSSDYMVRIPYYDPDSCLDFEYVEIRELIQLLESQKIELKPEDLQAIIKVEK